MSAFRKFDFSAIPAIPASPALPNSRTSRNSRGATDRLFLNNQAPGDDIRARLLADLARDPLLIRSVEVMDPEGDPVRVMVAIAHIGTCELQISRERWDPIEFLGLIETASSVRSR